MRPLPLRLTAAAVVTLAVCAVTVAQTENSTAPPPPAPRRFEPPITLGSLLDKIWWDPTQQGVLLLVAPESVRPLSPFERQEGGGRSIPLPTAGTDGKYRLAALDDYFDRRVVPLGGVTTYASRTMQVLNWQHLPPPNPFGSLSVGEKLHLLESTLTAAQWRQLGSPQGLGAGDLEREQRDLFLSFLPQPFALLPTRAVSDLSTAPNPPDAMAILPESVRSSVRLTLSRSLSWTFLTERPGGMVGMGRPTVPQAAPAYRLTGSGLLFGGFSPNGNVDVFGARLRENVPSRLKPGQLPWDWSVLQTRIAVQERETVGELIRRIAEATHAELFCDPRYADLSVYTRGTSATAADLLRAVCWSVTGTFRRVGPAYVLTDDLAGLGTRHAAIEAWAIPGGVFGYNAEKEAVRRLADSNYADYIGWSADDPLRPGEALSRRIEEFRKGTAGSLMVPLNELPEAAQSIVQEQVKSYNALDLPPAGQPIFTRSPIQTDKVQLNIQMHARLLVPGYGTVEMPNAEFPGGGLGLTPPQPPLLSRGYSNKDSYPAPPVPRVSLPVSPSLHALILASAPEDVLLLAAQEAKSHGFNQLWVTVTRDKTGRATAESAVRVGKATGLPVSLVVEVLRAGESEKDLPRDRSVLGETVREYAARRATEPLPQYPENYVLGAEQQPEGYDALRRQPDWLRIDDAPTTETVLASVTALAKTPGLAGIILRSVEAPGYGRYGQKREPAPEVSNAGLPLSAELGYTESIRLAFLRQAGMDPVDLSPFSSRGFLNLPIAPYQRFAATANLNLRNFPDEGTQPESSFTNGQNGLTIGAKDGWYRWNAFRRRLAGDFLLSVAESLQKNCPDLTVYRQWGNNSANSLSWIGTVDATTTAALRKEPGATERAAIPKRNENPFAEAQSATPTRLQRAHQYSAHASTVVTFNPKTAGIGYYSTVKDPAALFAFSVTYGFGKESPAWDGVVLDLGSVSCLKALPLLRVIEPADTAVPAKPAKKE